MMFGGLIFADKRTPIYYRPVPAAGAPFDTANLAEPVSREIARVAVARSQAVGSRSLAAGAYIVVCIQAIEAGYRAIKSGKPNDLVAAYRTLRSIG